MTETIIKKDLIMKFQSVIIKYLKEYNNLKNIGIYSQVPDEAKYPYIRLSKIDSIDNSTKTSYGQKITQYIEIYSRSKSIREILEIVTEVKNAITPINLREKDYILYYCNIESTLINQAKEELTWCSILECTGYIHKKFGGIYDA